MEEPISAFNPSLSAPPLVEGLSNEVLVLFALLFVAIAYLCKSLYHQFAYPAGPLGLANAQNPTPDQLREQFLAGKCTGLLPKRITTSQGFVK